MKAVWCVPFAAAAALAVTVLTVGSSAAGGDAIASAGAEAQWTTVYKSTLAIEGLAGDAQGNLYIAQRGGAAGCPVQRLDPSTGAATLVGTVPPPCSPSGLTFDADGNLYVTGAGSTQDTIAVLTPNAAAPPTATVYGTGVPGANGIAFDRDGGLWATDGTTGQGRVWRIPPGGGAGVEMFRIPAMANANGVGRQVQTLQGAAAAPNTQATVANGIELSHDGSTVYVADTARGAVWDVSLDNQGNVTSPVGCDPTYPADTLCLDSLLVQNPQLEGADGIGLDQSGDIWVDANERNAVVVVEPNGKVVEFFRNPVGANGLRNGGPLETPTSPVLLGHTLCTAQSDGNRRDNSPNSAGEVGPGTGFAGKVSCLQNRLSVPGMPLPIR